MIFTASQKLSNVFTCWKKLPKKKKKNCSGPPPPEHYNAPLFSSSFFGQKSLFFLQIHVPGYMEFCFFFKSMYPGTWNFVSSSNPCTRVHESEKKKYFLIMGGWTGFLFSFFFGNFFQQVKKLLNFWDAVNIKVAKFKLDHLRFYCKWDFFDRKIWKIRNWNQSWVLIGGTPCSTQNGL